MFSSACFLIVEGLLHDVCLQLGIPEADILGAGFQSKLDKIYNVYKADIHYPYYSFMFRLLRNQVVHGTAKSEELKEVADLLLLDLLDMAKITKSKKIPLNAKIYCLTHALENGSDKYAFLTGYLCLDDIVVPDFYDIREASGNVLRILETDEFWSYVDDLLESRFSDYTEIGNHLLKKIKNLRIGTLDKRCVERFRTHNKIKDKFDRDSYLNMLMKRGY
jgi:hypothetical protein